MELGLTSFAETGADAAGRPLVDHGVRLRNVVDEIRLADEVGLDVYGLGEHHRPDMAASAPAITLAAAASVTERIRLSSAVIVLSSADPVRTYQDFATLDLVSNGRAELLVGRGSFIESFPLFGYDLADYEDLFTEKLELLLEIAAHERVTWSGRLRAPLSDAGVYPRAQQDPLPIWVGVGGTPESIVRAARLGLPVALAIIGGDPARFVPFADLYRRALVQFGRDPAEYPLAVHVHGYVADDGDAIADELYPSYKLMMDRIGRERGWPPLSRQQYDAALGPNGHLFVGDPDTVAAKARRVRDLLGLDRFMIHGIGHVGHETQLRSIELLGTAVRERLEPTPAHS